MVTAYTLFSTFAVHHLVIGLVLLIVLFVGFRLFKVNAEIKSWLWATAFLASTIVPFAAFVPDESIEIRMVHTITETKEYPGQIAVPVVDVINTASTPQWHVPQTLVYESMMAISVFLLVWLTGSLWRLIGLGRSYFNTRKVVKFAQRIAHLQQGKIPVAKCQYTSAPMVVGLLKPTVILPSHIVDSLDEAQLIPIIMHELAHVKRGDLWVSLMQELLAIVFWWSPVMRGFNRQIHINRELACDFRAVKSLKSGKQYAQSLLDCAKLMVTKKQNLLAVGLFSKKKELTARVEAALASKAQRPNRPLRTAVACLSLVVATTSVAQNFAPKVNLADVAKQSRYFSQLIRLDGDALMDAISRRDIEAIKSLTQVEGVDINTPAIGDGTALIIAVRLNMPDMVKALVRLGADVNQPSRGDGNPLIMAAMTGNVEIAKMLLDYGADVNAIVVDDETPLINAARRGSLEMTRLLVEHGADVNLKVQTRWVDGSEIRSPLNMARNKAVRDFLLQYGATE